MSVLTCLLVSFIGGLAADLVTVFLLALVNDQIEHIRRELEE